MPKGYLYAAMAFSLTVEMLNIRARGKRRPAALALLPMPGDRPASPASDH